MKYHLLNNRLMLRSKKQNAFICNFGWSIFKLWFIVFYDDI